MSASVAARDWRHRAQTQERTARTGADLRWLDIAFSLAKFTHAKGVVIGAQADMWDPEKGAKHRAGYEPFIQSIATHPTDFGKLQLSQAVCNGP